jgi:hypothetical protein
VTAPTRRGFGTTVVELIPRMRLEAEVAHDYARAGMSWNPTRVLEWEDQP